MKPDPAIFPGFTEQLRHDFLYEAEAFISSIFLEDRSVVDLLTSDRTFLNDRLAAATTAFPASSDRSSAKSR